jgi:hypothetical protein
MRNTDEKRLQRLPLEEWDWVMGTCERLGITPIDFLGEVLSSLKPEVTERLETLYGHRTGTTLSLTAVKSGRSR